jgi:hypothetical protein
VGIERFNAARPVIVRSEFRTEKLMPFPSPAGECEAKQTKPVIRLALRIGFKPFVSRQEIKGLFGAHDGGNAVEPHRIGVYAAFEAA